MGRICAAWLVCQLIGFTVTVSGQQAGNRLILETNGPVGAVRSLRFSPDSRRLYAAGFDKQVHVWTIRDQAEPDRGLSATHVQYFRWEVNRAERGSLYAMDIGPQGQLAMGGYSAEGNAGDVVVYGLATRRIERAYPIERPETANQPARGHRHPVLAVSFSPDGKKLASMSLDGETRLWHNNLAQRLTQPRRWTNSNQTVAFIDNRYLAIGTPQRWRELTPEATPTKAKEILGGTWLIHFFDTDASRFVAQRRKHAHQLGVPTIAADPFQPGRWASADGHGSVFVWRNATTAEGPVAVKNLWTDPIKAGEVRAMQFGPDDQLLLATSKYDEQDSKRQARLILTSLRDGQIRIEDSIPVDYSERSRACAISPDGKVAAVFAGDANQVWLYPIVQAGRGQRFDRANRVVLGSRGRSFRQVAFSENSSTQLALAETEGVFNLGFDFSSSKILRNPQVIRPRPPVSNGWVMQTQPGAHVLSIQHTPTKTARTIVLDAVGQGPMETHCWLHNAQGAVYGVAIGTAQQNGLFVYSLKDTDDRNHCRLLRYFRDHRDRIQSLAVSRDGAYLASSSADQTIKIWSLGGVEEPKGPSPNAVGWGGTFQVRQNELVVASLDDNGILAQREFKQGDVIEQLEYRQDSKQQMANTPAEMLDMLRTRPLWQPLRYSVRGRNPTEIRGGWQPLLTLFILRDDSWAVWTPQGYYDASLVGDEFFGWVQNRGRDQTPRFYRAAHFRPELEKPQVIRNLLAAGQLIKAFEQAGIPRPDNFQNPVPNLLEIAPSVRIINPIDGVTLEKPGGTITVEAEVFFASPDQFGQFIVKAYVNQSYGVKQSTQRVPERNVIRYTFQVNATDPNSVIQVKLFETGAAKGDNDQLRADDHLFVNSADSRLKKLNMHFVGIGGSNYPGRQDDLSGCEDVKAFQQKLKDLQQGSQYNLSLPKLYLEQDVQPAAIKNAQNELTQTRQVTQDDLLIVFLAGHGARTAQPKRFLFVPSSVRPINPDPKLCIGKQELAGLANMNCRRLFIVDACHAGQLVQDLEGMKELVRPWFDDNIAVWCASKASQQALQLNGVKAGRFTSALIDAINGKADSDDGFVTLRETKMYLANAFTEMEKQFFQEPELISPQGAESLLDLKLFKTKIARRAIVTQ